METPQVNRKQIDDLRAWFFAKDRSISLAQSCLYYLFAGGQPNTAYMSMAFISETILSASAASVTFSNIPQNFRHLLIFLAGRTDVVAESDIVAIRFNSDSGGNYDSQRLTANDTTLSGDATRAETSARAGLVEGSSSRGNCFAPGIIFISSYSLSGIEKYTISWESVIGNLSADTDLFISMRGSHWRNTNVCTSITILPLTGPNFVSSSRFQLYGIL